MTQKSWTVKTYRLISGVDSKNRKKKAMKDKISSFCFRWGLLFLGWFLLFHVVAVTIAALCIIKLSWKWIL